MTRQNFTGRFAQLARADCKNSEHEIKNKPDKENKPSGNQAHLGATDEFVKAQCRLWMQIDFQVPTCCQQCEQPDIVSAQAPANRFPDTDGEMGREKIRGQMRSPLLISRLAFRRKHLGKVTGLDYANAAGPDFIVTVSSRFH